MWITEKECIGREEERGNKHRRGLTNDHEPGALQVHANEVVSMSNSFHLC